MNKVFLAFAAILSSGIFAFSYWSEWINFRLGNAEIPVGPDDFTPPYYYASTGLYQQVLLIFACAFLLIFGFAMYAVVKKKWGQVMFAFSLSMLCILAVMINGAIK
ncbi:hypothetical protein [Mongoliitalea daihaiensis]|uniref:hypothetical protein n=1 Tax=Mongoliitalea daihaiensis TaxID=2782006 RepID=UPI001F18F8A4|nr:hypothetical protein [Mongoliitalea daihaiensis]UJP64764.1 hypothetical protein IPZ59_18540 [Mongoliitalea daihaiensis]